MKVRLTSNARLDLYAIHDWIAQDDPEAASRFAEELRSKAREIGDLPLGYPLAAPRRTTSLRKRSWRNYLIVYRVTSEVEIVGFFHVRRDYLSKLDEL